MQHVGPVGDLLRDRGSSSRRTPGFERGLLDLRFGLRDGGPWPSPGSSTRCRCSARLARAAARLARRLAPAARLVRGPAPVARARLGLGTGLRVLARHLASQRFRLYEIALPTSSAFLRAERTSSVSSPICLLVLQLLAGLLHLLGHAGPAAAPVPGTSRRGPSSACWPAASLRTAPPTKPAAAVAMPTTTAALDPFALALPALPPAPEEALRLRDEANKDRRLDAFDLLPVLLGLLLERADLLLRAAALGSGRDDYVSNHLLSSRLSCSWTASAYSRTRFGLGRTPSFRSDTPPSQG